MLLISGVAVTNHSSDSHHGRRIMLDIELYELVAWNFQGSSYRFSSLDRVLRSRKVNRGTGSKELSWMVLNKNERRETNGKQWRLTR